MTYSILSEARVEASIGEQGGSSRPYSVYWSENKNLQGWTTFINLDIVGAWGGFLFATKTTASGSQIGPSSTFVPVDAQTNDHIFFRMKYDKHPKNVAASNVGKIQWTTTADALFTDDKSVPFTVIPDGKWHFYDLDMAAAQEWVGLINNIRFFPCENGARNDEVFLNFFELGSTDFSFAFDDSRAGTPGQAVGSLALNSEITIEKDINDKLLVNINGYGNVQITLTPQTAQPETIARDIGFQLGKAAIGGYTRAKARIDIESRKLIIESGTRAADSSVLITFGPNSAAPTLGFTDITGFSLTDYTAGTDPASDYIPISSYKPTTLEINSLFDTDSDLAAFSINPQIPLVEGGRRDFATTNRKLTTETYVEGRGETYQGQTITTTDFLDVSGLTVIDLNHPFSDDGKIDTIWINGIPNTSGGTKWKIFRPKLDGSLEFVAEGVIGQTTITPNPSGGLVLSTEPGVFTANVSTQNIFVRRGDLLGIYNTKLHVGSFGTLKPDALYYSVAGDVTSDFTPNPPVGAGEAGLPLYAQSTGTKRQAVIDIDLGRRMNLESLRVFGEENTTDLEYNLAIANSANFSTDVTGNHTICYTISPALGRECFTRTNVGYNLQALNDGVIYANNGITTFGSPGKFGTGGANVTGATYFYVNGDAEHLGVHEFNNNNDPLSYDFFRDPVGIDCFFGSSTPRLDKPIGKAVIYFKDKKNQRSWQIEYALPQGNSGGNGSKNGWNLIDEDTITEVSIDNKTIHQVANYIATKDGLQDLLLSNPSVLDVIALDGTRNPQQGTDFTTDAGQLGGVNFRDQVTFIEFQWNRFEWVFDSVRAPGFRWYSDFHWSTKISEFEVYAVSRSFESLGDNIQVLFSEDGETFASAPLISASTTQADYKLANSPQYLRLIFRPTVDLTLTDVEVNFETDQISFGEEGRITEAMAVRDARVGSMGTATPLKITNHVGQTADLIIDIPPDTTPSRQLMYFSKLNSLQDVQLPQVGPPGRIDFTPDKTLLEYENVALGAKTYGLLPLTANVSTFETDNLLTNGDFETGNLTGWSLVVTQSGTKRFQVPRVMDIATDGQVDEDTASAFQTGDYVFGFSLDNQIPEQNIGTSTPGPDLVPVYFTLSTDVIDVSEFATSIDLGTGHVNTLFDYLAIFGPLDEGPVLHVLGSPTISGVNLSPGSVVNSSYGTNILRTIVLEQATSANTQTTPNGHIIVSQLLSRIKLDTRYIRITFEVAADTSRTSGSGASTIRREKFLLDEVSVKLRLSPDDAVRWYKSWRTGSGDFTDASYLPVTEFTTITGSTHWYQPFRDANGAAPGGDQTLGFSNAFTSDRNKGIQSYRRMSPFGDEGILGGQWSGEKTIVGFRIALGHFTSGALSQSCGYPRIWHVEVLQTSAELGGLDPDINNVSHYKLVKVVNGSGPFDNSNTDLLGESGSTVGGPGSRILTWFFDTPQTTEGMRLVFTTNCDRFEVVAFTGGSTSATGANFTALNAHSTCPDNITPGTGFSCTYGLGAAFFQPLESVGVTTLPIDNVREHEQAAGNIYAAVNLRRRYAIETDADLFELVADTESQSFWNASNFVLSSSNTDDPNAVVWGNTSASDVRWIRFSTTSEEKFEDPSQLYTSSITSTNSQELRVINLPQSTLQVARVYPDITTSLIFTQGANAQWEDLGDILTDNSNATFISYTDYPVIAVDLNRPYLLSNESTVFRKKHDLVSYRPLGDQTDRFYWNPNDDTNFTYSQAAFQSVSAPSKVTFSPYGTTPPNIAVRWVAFKGNGPAQQANNTTGPKKYLSYSNGGTLFNVAWRPREPEVFTENFNWFSTKLVGLSDVSTIETFSGSPFSVVKGVDYGANQENMGDPFNAFDGSFDELEGDVWGVALRDIRTFLPDPARDFPHKIFRVFRDLFRGEFQTKNIRSVFIKGYNENFYPTDFSIQRLKSTIALQTGTSASVVNTNKLILARDSSWTTISDGTFTGVDTFDEGQGFTVIFPTLISTRGIRIVIDDSVYIDDSVQTQTSDDGTDSFSTLVNTSGPETRVSEIVLYEEALEELTLQGTIDINHMSNATVSSTTAVPDQGPALVKDGSISTYWQSTGFQDTLTITLPSAKTIHRLGWEKNPALGQASGALSTNAPQDFRLRAVVGLSTITVLTVVDFIGNSYSGDLSSPVTASSFFLDITKVQGEHEDASSIQISEVRLIEEFTQTTPLVTIEEVVDRHTDGSTNITSTLLRYASGSDAEARVTLDGIDGNEDSDFSERDFFQFYLKINDLSLLDTNSGSIRIGNSTEAFYQWNLSSIPGLHSGWNKVKLQFINADDRSEVTFQSGANYDPDFGYSKVDFITPDAEVTTSSDGVTSYRVLQAPGIRYFDFLFRGTKGASELQLTLDDMRFVRNRFDDVCKFSTGLYLNRSETFLLNLDGVDIDSGTVEFWMQPDWDPPGQISRGKLETVIPAIFRIIRPDGRFLSLFYRPAAGFTAMIYDGESLKQFESDFTLYRFERYDTFHFRLVWDSDRRATDNGASLAMYINGEPVFGSNATWRGLRESGASVIIGGELGQRFAATPHNSTALAFTAVPTLPAKNTSSTWAVLENLKIYNYPKTDFSDIYVADPERTQLVTPSQLIEVSTDGVTFYPSGSDQLPLVVEDILDGASTTIYVRTNIPKGLTGQEQRDASLLVRWKAPLRQCS